MVYQNRQEAGRALAGALAAYRGTDAVVYALPRGGVVLGAEVARALALPLDLVITRKIGHPMNPEYAICAISESGQLVCNEEERARVEAQWFAEAMARERAEAARRRERYLGGRHGIPATGKTAILVDDGIATGLTMLAAIREISTQQPREIVVAIPVVPRDTADRLAGEGARVVALEIPEVFLGAVGMYYGDFRPVSDDEVIRLLQVDPVIFAMPAYQPLAQELLPLPGMRPGQWAAKRFANGERQILLRTAIRNEDALVIGSLAPPDEDFLTVALLCDTLRKEGAFIITLLAPYLAYTRQDRNEAGKSQAAAWLGAVLQASGVTEVVTVDIHSASAADLIPVPVVSLSPAPLFAAEMIRRGWEEATLVAPDEGAMPRCEDVRVEAHIDRPIAHMVKERTPAGVRGELVGPVGRRAVVIDDILDTGSTLIACCEALRAAGVGEILVLVTHGLFTGETWRQLWELRVTAIGCTDTVPLPERARDARIQTLSVLPVLALFLRGARVAG